MFASPPHRTTETRIVATFLNTDGANMLYVRIGNTTHGLTGREAAAYMRNHWR